LYKLSSAKRGRTLKDVLVLGIVKENSIRESYLNLESVQKRILATALSTKTKVKYLVLGSFGGPHL